MAAMSPQWQKYYNHKYAYNICYPSQILVPLGESDAGDGQVFAIILEMRYESGVDMRRKT